MTQQEQGSKLVWPVTATIVVDVDVDAYLDEYGTEETLSEIAAYVRERLSESIRAEFASSAHWATIRIGQAQRRDDRP